MYLVFYEKKFLLLINLSILEIKMDLFIYFLIGKFLSHWELNLEPPTNTPQN